jgi:hypothetical protein
MEATNYNVRVFLMARQQANRTIQTMNKKDQMH